MLRKIYKWFERLGAMRAAAELARQGYHKQAKQLILRLK